MIHRGERPRPHGRAHAAAREGAGSPSSLLVVALFHASVDVAFTSDAAPESAVAIAGALITLWGLAVLVVAGPRFLSLRGKVVGLDGGGTGFVERGRIGTGGAWKS